MKHILLKKLDARKIKQPEPIANFYYDVQGGYWKSYSNLSLMVNDDNFRTIGSKKRDLETGEDQK